MAELKKKKNHKFKMRKSQTAQKQLLQAHLVTLGHSDNTDQHGSLKTLSINLIHLKIKYEYLFFPIKDFLFKLIYSTRAF